MRPGFGQVEWYLAEAALEQVHAGADHDRVDEEAKLVEQALGEQVADRGGTGGDCDDPTGLLLELGEFGDDVAADHCGGSPVGVVERSGDDHLRRAGHHRGVRRGGRAGEHGTEQIVGTPPVQVDVSVGQLRQHRPVQLLVVIGGIPLFRRLDHAVQRDEQPRGDRSHPWPFPVPSF
jgi:hypothetical protein